MPTNKEVLISQKFNNYNYAPGIATYGIDGKIGEAGVNGNNIYFTDYVINDPSGSTIDLTELMGKIIENKMPIKDDNTKITKKYQNDDLFFDKNGIIYKLHNIEEYSAGHVVNIYTDFFKIAGKIKLSDNNNHIFEFVGSNRLLLNERFKGYDIATGINSTDVSNYINNDAATNIISANIDSNDNIEMIKMVSIDDVDIEDGQLLIYYKTTDNAYYADSNKPIVINADLKLNNSSSLIEADYDNFSSVLTSNDTITYFKHICDKLRYNILYDGEAGKYKIHIYSTEEDESDQQKTLDYLINRNETVFGKIYTGENEQVLAPIYNASISLIDSSNYTDYSSSAADLNNFSISKEIIGFYPSVLGEYTVTNIDENMIDLRVIDASDNCKNIMVNLNTASLVKNNKRYVYGNLFVKDHLFAVKVKNNISDDVSLNSIVIAEDSQGINIHTEILNNDSIKYVNENDYVYIDETATYKYIFNSNENEMNTVEFGIYPLIAHQPGDTTDDDRFHSAPPIKAIFNVNLNRNTKYAVYFKMAYTDTDFIIKQIMISDKLDLDQKIEDKSEYNIIVDIPINVQSVAKFSLLHNTEIFLQYQS